MVSTQLKPNVEIKGWETQIKFYFKIKGWETNLKFKILSKSVKNSSWAQIPIENEEFKLISILKL